MICVTRRSTPPPSPECSSRTDAKHDATIDQHIAPLGLHQNHHKKEIIASFRGKQANAMYRLAKSNSSTTRIVDQMLYLGAWLTGSGSNTPELSARLSAAWKR